MTEGRAAIFAESGAPVCVEDVVVDEPGPGEVRVRLLAAGVCHTDFHIVRSGGWRIRFPIVLGHEGAGIVDAVGEGVETVAPGARVVLGWRSPCGGCAACLRGAPRLCRSPLRARRRVRRAADGAALTPALLVGAFATHAVVHADAAVELPPELPPEQACLIGCAVATGVGAVLTTSPAWPGSQVVVIGCGGVGLSAIQGARIAGAARIVAVDVAAAKLEQAFHFGATDVVDASAAEPADAVRELTGGEGADFAYDAVGRPDTLAGAVAMLAHGGTATLIGIPSEGTYVTLPLAPLFDARATLRVSHGGDHLPGTDFPRLASLALEGRLDLASMVSRTIELDEVAEALEELDSFAGVRTVVRFAS